MAPGDQAGSLTEAVTIWTCATHHPAFGCGGWAYVRLDRGQRTGAAGGERRTTARRMALAGLSAAVRDLADAKAVAPAAAIRVRTSSVDLAAFSRVLAGEDADITEDLDLWAPILSARRSRRISLSRLTVQPDSPLAFTSAWAELAMDKAKAAGAFTSPIPRANLARIADLENF